MPKLIHPTGAEIIGDHRVRIRFEDGLEGELDFSGFSWQGVFSPLQDPEFFARGGFDPALRTLAWPNGADIAPETLHYWVARGLERVPA